MERREEGVFAEYRYRRASTDIAELIKQAILSEEFKEGDRLPPERDLAVQFQVGRMTIREALRTLETKGLIAIRKGSSGGAFVQPAPPTQIAEIIVDNLQLDGVSYSEIADSRVVLEVGIVKYAIQNATPEDLDLIEKNVEEAKALIHESSPEGARTFFSNSIDFHRLIAQSAHIPPLLIFHSALAEWVLRRLVKRINPTEEQRLHSYRSHLEIFEAIKSKDVALSQKLLEDHIRMIIDSFELNLGK